MRSKTKINGNVLIRRVSLWVFCAAALISLTLCIRQFAYVIEGFRNEIKFYQDPVRSFLIGEIVRFTLLATGTFPALMVFEAFCKKVFYVSLAYLFVVLSAAVYVGSLLDEYSPIFEINDALHLLPLAIILFLYIKRRWIVDWKWIPLGFCAPLYYVCIIYYTGYYHYFLRTYEATSILTLCYWVVLAILGYKKYQQSFRGAHDCPH